MNMRQKFVGIQINKTKMAVYALTGFISALAGILMVLRLGSSQVNIGETGPCLPLQQAC